MLKGPIKPFLMFSGARHGKAEEAINFHVSIMPGSRIVSIDRVSVRTPRRRLKGSDAGRFTPSA